MLIFSEFSYELTLDFLKRYSVDKHEDGFKDRSVHMAEISQIVRLLNFRERSFNHINDNYRQNVRSLFADL